MLAPGCYVLQTYSVRVRVVSALSVDREILCALWLLDLYVILLFLPVLVLNRKRGYKSGAAGQSGAHLRENPPQVQLGCAHEPMEQREQLSNHSR